MPRRKVKPAVVLGVDGAGCIVSQASVASIQPKWRPPLERTIAAYKERFGPALRSVYVRGSVPLGRARNGISDIDTFAVIADDEEYPNTDWAKSLSLAVSREWPFVTAVEALTFPISAMHTSRWLISTIKTQSACLCGPDFARDILGFRPGIDMVFAAWDLPEHLAIARRLAATLGDQEEARTACRWATKRLIRSAFELVMKRAKCYTRDLQACCEIFSTYYPDKAPSLARVLPFALGRRSPMHFAAVADNLGHWLYAEICLTYGADRIAQMLEPDDEQGRTFRTGSEFNQSGQETGRVLCT
jgi:uncharacterized protein